MEHVELLTHGELRLHELPPVRKRARAVAIGYIRPEPDGCDHPQKGRADASVRFRYIEGAIATLIKRHPELKGAVSLITDHFGILKYTHFQSSLEIYLQLLKVGGRVYFSEPNANIRNHGRKVSLLSYLSQIEGVRVTQQQDGHQGYVIEKTASRVSVPPLRYLSAKFNHDVGPITEYELER
jgi:hypothetical protein